MSVSTFVPLSNISSNSSSTSRGNLSQLFIDNNPATEPAVSTQTTLISSKTVKFKFTFHLVSLFVAHKRCKSPFEVCTTNFKSSCFPQFELFNHIIYFLNF
jgi:hypothetical protein